MVYRVCVSIYNLISISQRRDSKIVCVKVLKKWVERVEIKGGKAAEGAGIKEQVKRIPSSLSIKRKCIVYWRNEAAKRKPCYRNNSLFFAAQKKAMKKPHTHTYICGVCERALESMNDWLNDDGENVQTKINSICLHVEMCMSDCRKTQQNFHFSLYTIWNGLWTTSTTFAWSD